MAHLVAAACDVPRLRAWTEELPKAATGKTLERAIDRDRMVAEGGRA